ncbi:MAG: hypothetical protein H6719_14740 [Sandaracinaceae bacterium]|nr:hypothetical protein [Sandaracinaceae bacterium]
MVRVSPPRDFVFDQLTAGQSQTLTVMERIDCTGYDKVDLLVRVHEDSTITTNGAVAVQLVSDGFTQDDPSQDFFSTVLGGQAPIVFGEGSVDAGTFEVATVSSELGSRVAVQVVGTGGSGAVTLRLSIDLVLKQC